MSVNLALIAGAEVSTPSSVWRRASASIVSLSVMSYSTEPKNAETFATSPLVEIVPGVVGVRSGLLDPPEPYLLDLATGVLRPLARLSGFVPPSHPPTVDELRIEVAPDGARARTMHAFVIEPARPNGRTLVWIHGGPVAAWGDHWHWRWSALAMAEAGYRVIQPNPSGSTGYGMDWVNDIWGNSWGGRCYDDLMQLVARLEADGARAHDMVMMGDVIEHIEKEAALDFLDHCRGWVVIATPVEHFDTGPDLPPTEAHVSHWTLADFEATGRLDQHEIAYGAHVVRLAPR